MEGFKERKDLIREIGLKEYVCNRLVTPQELLVGIKISRKYRYMYKHSLIRMVGTWLFWARYDAGKAILGYDYI